VDGTGGHFWTGQPGSSSPAGVWSLSELSEPARVPVEASPRPDLDDRVPSWNPMCSRRGLCPRGGGGGQRTDTVYESCHCNAWSVLPNSWWNREQCTAHHPRSIWSSFSTSSSTSSTSTGFVSSVTTGSVAHRTVPGQNLKLLECRTGRC